MRTISQFIWRKHALERMLERSISRNEVIQCAYNGEIIETYPEDFPYPSSLVLQVEGKILHIVMALNDEECYIITAYRPNLDEFENDFKTRKKR
ncbi:MAG: DUF4258 domain-containing protein [Sulfuricurvum sp.]|nr:DUF4258 domain-containing protein [Sulfuricurvum sp.]